VLIEPIYLSIFINKTSECLQAALMCLKFGEISYFVKHFLYIVDPKHQQNVILLCST